jgi:acetolactate synthase-1/2/3 large subunit
MHGSAGSFVGNVASSLQPLADGSKVGDQVWVDNADSLAQKAGQARARDSFSMLACRIDKSEYDGSF